MALKAAIFCGFLPLFLCQMDVQLDSSVYFPDEKSGGYLQVANKAQVQDPLSVLPVNLTELRGTATYDQYVDKIISSGVLKLTLDVEKAITNTSVVDNDNIVFAPLSIAAALALVLLGSAGKTFDEVAHIMGLSTGVDIQSRSQLVHEQFGRMLNQLERTSGFEIGHQVNFATALFVQNEYPIRKVYQEVAESVYQSEVLNVDFQTNPLNAQQIINAWVSERTNGKITQLLGESPSSETKVILASAMYFKAAWEKPFFDGSTKRRPFFVNGRGTNTDIMVEMMSNGGQFPYHKDKSLDCEILGFPYKGNQTTMYVVLPNNSNKDKLKQLQSALTPSEIERLVNSVSYRDAVLIFPRMRIESTIDLSHSLQQIGVKSLFNPSEANLALLSPGIGKGTVGDRTDLSAASTNPLAGNHTSDNVLIFTRNKELVNCTSIFDPTNNITTCAELVNTPNQQTVVFKKFGNKIGKRVQQNKISPRLSENLDQIRQTMNQLDNPGLYADNVIHKVYMDITESGTEAAASTSVSLTRDGGKVAFRVDVPFFFFIMHEQTKTPLFWGSVNKPTPSFT